MAVCDNHQHSTLPTHPLSPITSSPTARSQGETQGNFSGGASQADVDAQDATSATFPAVQVAFPTSLMRREAGKLRCLACARRCLLGEGVVGYCTAVINRQGALYNTAFGVIAEASVTPIESKPVYHFHPGSRTLSLGGLGCNLHCTFCQNWEIAYRDARDAATLAQPNLPPDAAVALALEQGCQGLAWSHNEPSITPTYTLESARAARAAGLFTVFVTNGLCTREAIDVIGPWLDVYRVDIKSSNPAFYRRIGNFDRIDDIVPVARHAQREYGVHVEVVTNLMPGLNESDEQLARLASSVADSLGPDTPWHLTTYVPYAFMTDVPPTPPATLARAKAVGLRAGLRYIYTDSITDTTDSNTYCPSCGALLIQRFKGKTQFHMLTNQGRCGGCGRRSEITLPTSPEARS